MNSPEKFEKYAEMLREWSQKMNLVAPSTLSNIENRHFAESAQLAEYLPRDVEIIDLGSGAGFPGVVLAILGFQVLCTESIGKKAEFLTAVRKELGLESNLRIYCGRVEPLLSIFAGSFDKKRQKDRENLTKIPGMMCEKPREIIFTARAFAPLIKILGYVRGIRCRLYLLKGRDVEKEIALARRKYNFDYEMIPSKTGDGFVLIVHFAGR